MSVKSFFNRIFLGFLNGIFVLTPVVITVLIIRFLVVKLDDIILKPFLKLITFGGKVEIQHIYFAKGVIFIAVIFLIVVIGWGTRILVLRKVFSFGEKMLIKVPVLGRIYNAVKQVFSTFFGHGKTIFKHVVLVEYPRKGVKSLGFVTAVAEGEVARKSGLKDPVNVFIPNVPNPATGFYIIVAREEVIFLDMGMEDAMKLVVSGGAFDTRGGKLSGDENAGIES